MFSTGISTEVWLANCDFKVTTASNLYDSSFCIFQVKIVYPHAKDVPEAVRVTQLNEPELRNAFTRMLESARKKAFTQSIMLVDTTFCDFCNTYDVTKYLLAFGSMTARVSCYLLPSPCKPMISLCDFLFA